MVLSGHYPDDFVAALKKLGIDGFLRLPFEEAILLRDVAALLYPSQHADLETGIAAGKSNGE